MKRMGVVCPLGVFGLLVAALLGGPAKAQTVHVAVAANFAEALEPIASAFTELGSDRLVISLGSTGQLYAKIKNGAPYEVFLSADAERPRLLVEEGDAVPGSRVTYAEGRLVLWSADPDLIDGPAILRRGGWRHLAIASPDLAPYGAAAEQSIRSLGLWDAVASRLVRGADIGQTFQFVATGNAEIGFVALSQVLSPRNPVEGSAWRVPRDLHEPIRQDAVLLKRGRGNAAARRFLDFLRSDEAALIIERFGYERGQ